MVLAQLLFRNQALGIRISGHANAGEYSKDLICAAVSGMAQMTEIAIDGILGLKKTEKSSGDFMIPPLEDPQGQLFIQALFEGIRVMEKQYPGNIRTERMESK